MKTKPPFEAIRATEFKFNDSDGTVDCKRVPWHFIRHALTCASLYNSLSIREEQLGVALAKLDPEHAKYSSLDKSNLIYCETFSRQLRLFQARMETSAGISDSSHGYAEDEANEESVTKRIESEASRPENYTETAWQSMPVPETEPFRTLAVIRNLTIEMLEQIGYVSQTTRGMQADNWYNRPEFALEKLQALHRLCEETIPLMEKVCAIRKEIEARPKQQSRSLEHPLERAT